jgi:sulfate transport system ATP-binding protein
VNLFHGRVEAGQAVFGPLVVDHPAGAPSGALARLFVRPHEVEVGRERNGKPAFAAHITRIQSAGPVVKLELRSEAGPVHVELSHEQFRREPLTAGEQVWVSVRDGKVFAETA